MIRATASGGVGRVTISRPERRNALTAEMLGDLRSAIETLGDSAGSILLDGEGPVFCAGFDLALCRGSTDGSEMRSLLRGLDAVVGAMRDCPAPVVAAAQGAAIAGGCALVAGADIVVADRPARFGYPVVLLGVSPAVSAPALRARAGSGPTRVRMLDPGLVDADAARSIGLVTEVVEDAGAVAAAALRIAQDLAAKPRGALATTKRWMHELGGAPESGAVGLEASLGLAGGAEERDLLEAFWASRPP